MSRWCVVLAGGIGSRFWPLSTAEQPKQLLPLATDKPLLVDALERLRPIVDDPHILVLTNASLSSAVRALAPELPSENVIAEPRPAGTAAALTWAAHSIAERDGRDATMISVHADWAIGDEERFRSALLTAERVAVETRSLVTVGVVPSRPDPGFGYIEPSESGTQPSRVKKFVEKPDEERAQKMCDAGYLWNSGIFVWRVGDFLDEVKAHAPAIASALQRSPSSAGDFFAAVGEPVTVDVAVLEQSSRMMVVPGDFGWDDIGTWAALARVRQKDPLGNVSSGNVDLVDSADNVVYAGSGRVVLFGVHGLVVVTKGGLTLVTNTHKASDLKRLVESLPAIDA